MNYLKCFNILFLTTLSLYCFILEVYSIDCPRATAWPISIADLKEMYEKELHYYTNKYYIASNYAEKVFFPAEYTRMSFMNFGIYEHESPLMQTSVFTFQRYLNNGRVMNQHCYQFKMDTNLPIFEIYERYGTRTYLECMSINPPYDVQQELRTLKFALVYVDEESNNSFSIYQSCDGKYAWAQIRGAIIQEYFNAGRDPFDELNDKINTKFNNLNIENGVIYNTSDNRIVYGPA